MSIDMQETPPMDDAQQPPEQLAELPTEQVHTAERPHVGNGQFDMQTMLAQGMLFALNQKTTNRLAAEKEALEAEDAKIQARIAILGGAITTLSHPSDQ